jgi:hypothetical protein
MEPEMIFAIGKKEISVKIFGPDFSPWCFFSRKFLFQDNHHPHDWSFSQLWKKIKSKTVPNLPPNILIVPTISWSACSV